MDQNIYAKHCVIREFQCQDIVLVLVLQFGQLLVYSCKR